MVRNSGSVASGVEQRKYGKSFIMRCDDYIIFIKYIKVIYFFKKIK